MGRETCHSREKVWTTNFARSYHVALAINNPERERERERERETLRNSSEEWIALGYRIVKLSC